LKTKGRAQHLFHNRHIECMSRTLNIKAAGKAGIPVFITEPINNLSVHQQVNAQAQGQRIVGHLYAYIKRLSDTHGSTRHR